MSSYFRSHSRGRRAAAAGLIGALMVLSACASGSGGAGADGGANGMGTPGAATRTAGGDVAMPGGAPAMPMSAAEMFTDPAIAATASVSNHSEIVPSQLALQKSQNAHVRAMAQRMIDEHTRFETQMQQLLQQKGMAPMHNAFSYQLQQNLQPMMQELQGASGAQFDQLYVGHLVSSHMTTLHALDTSLIPNARDPEMKAMLQGQVRPAVAQHYAETLRLQAQVAHGAASGAPGQR